MTFYRGSLAKFLRFLGKRSDDSLTEVTKQDVVSLPKFVDHSTFCEDDES